VTQAPTDVPSSVLSQLGNRVQHALRAFTPEDADNLRKAARTFPMTDHYDVERTLTSLGIGEALVTVLNPKGVPTPLAATRLVPPDSRMSPLTPQEIATLVAASPLAARYGEAIDRESAHEIITGRLANAKAAVATATAAATADGAGGMTPAQQQRELARRAKEIEAERKAAERERKAREKEAAAMARERERTMRATVNTVGKVLGSRETQSLLRGVFGTIFGGGKR
jgi:hypothetical protein